jgi:FHA domain
MKQYWTPLAKWLGMAKAATDAVPSAAMGNLPMASERLTNAAAAHASMPAGDAAHSHWPDLFNALQAHAQIDWVLRSQRHADVNPEELLAITRLQIRASSPALEAQLQQWFSESDVPHLIQWMVRGPFKTVAIERWVVLDRLERLEVLPFVPAVKTNASPYDVSAVTPQAPVAGFDIVAETQWVPKPVDLHVASPLPPLELVIHDALGERRVHVMQTLVVLGAEKTLKAPDGQKMRLLDQSPMHWQGETAWFVAVHAQHVSGIHMVLRLHEGGVDCLDDNSTNGSFVSGQKWMPGQWHLVKHVETVYLGGVASDPRSQTACVQLRVGHPVMPISADRTPLRQATPEHTWPKVLLQPVGATGAQAVSVLSLPFIIGRAPDTDWVVPAEHEMVSRQHVVIEAVDEKRQRVLLRDVSRQGLTESREGFSGPASQGVWVSFSDTVTLGKTARHRGMSFGFSGLVRDPRG